MEKQLNKMKSQYFTIVNHDYTYEYFSILASNIYSYNELLHIIYLRKLTICYRIDEIQMVQIKARYSDLIPLSSISNLSIDKTSEVYLRVKEGRPMARKIQWDVSKTTNDYTSYLKCKGSHKHSVALIDSGIDLTHTDLKPNLLYYENFVPKYGFKGKEDDETGESFYMEDKLDHGTQVAGQICANGNITSIAPNTGLKVYRVFGGKSADNIWILKAIIEASKNGSDVINLSLGDYILSHNNTEIKAYKKAIQYARSNGCVIVGALGNDGINIDDNDDFLKYIKSKKRERDDYINSKSLALDLPAQQDNVIGVASASKSNLLSSYSNKSDKYIDVLSYGGDNELLTEYGYDMWIENEWIKNEWILTTSSKFGHTYTIGNSIAAGKVSAAIAAMNTYYNISQNPSLSERIFFNNLKGVLNMKDVLKDGYL
ncbi:S8 family serine peptidase [Staphylococcus hominis]|uniref:S8 family serine peptidase n=1 Tax=Staphylococcus hominis TaxID=1290 RepID=UPI001F5A808D|nr:S8 family serine peptidase [Staphylococcus hominis]MCI2902505.1 S8 family serine peptidase [Staphylococcus hominis]